MGTFDVSYFLINLWYQLGCWWISGGLPNLKTVPYIAGCCCLLLGPSYATNSDEGLASFVVADNGSIAATLVLIFI